MRVEIIDGRPEDLDRDITVKRFPTWGDAADLIELLDVRHDGGLSFVGSARATAGDPSSKAVRCSDRPSSPPAVTRPAGVSSRPTCSFCGRPTPPVRSVSNSRELSAGRTFSTLTVQVLQDGRCCAAGTLLLDVTSRRCHPSRRRPTTRAGPLRMPRRTTWASPDATSGWSTAPTPTTLTRPSARPSWTLGPLP